MRRVVALGALLLMTACTAAGGDTAAPTTTAVAAPSSVPQEDEAGIAASEAPAPAEPAAPTTTAPPAPPETAPPPPPPTTTTTEAPRPGPRTVTEQDFVPFAVAGELVTLHHPARRVERIGFHQATHDGTREMAVAATAVQAMTLDSRHRGTSANSAADIVVDPNGEIRSPVSGTVKRGGRYILYCDNVDHYLVIEPDARPGWEVKVLHINSTHVGVGDRVEAGVTVIADGPTQLPFKSQVDEHRSMDPAWPHVHVEVVDPSIPDRKVPGTSNC